VPETPRRRRFQIHLSTAVVLMFVAGGVLWLNFSMATQYCFCNTDHIRYQALKDIDDELLNHTTHHIWEYCISRLQMGGWPMKFIWKKENGIVSRGHGQWTKEEDENISDYEIGAKIVDTCVALAILLVVWFLFEWLTGRRATRKGA